MSEVESKEQINERSSATESAVVINEDAQNLAADAEAADQVNQFNFFIDKRVKTTTDIVTKISTN